MRTLVDLPDDELGLLADLGHRRGTSRAAVIRDAVHVYLAARQEPAAGAAFGLWGAGEDGLAWQERMRAEW